MKKIVWTCDTEIGELADSVENAYDIFVLGKVQGKEVGINYINELAKKYGAVVHHFVDVYQPKYSKAIIEACERILADGHSIGLHTHPSTMYGKRYMHEYSLSEQQSIIEYGQNFFEKHTGYSPISHRAGGYGADENTILALESAGIKIDSSYYYNNEHCRLPQMSVNSINNYYNNVLEVPVTVYGVRKNLAGIPMICRKIIWQKLDFRYGSNAQEILNIVGKAPDNSVVLLFLHSFNFLCLEYNMKKNKYNKINISHNLISEYEYLLREIALMKDCEYSKIDVIKNNVLGWNCNINREMLNSNLKDFIKKWYGEVIYV